MKKSFLIILGKGMGKEMNHEMSLFVIWLLALCLFFQGSVNASYSAYPNLAPIQVIQNPNADPSFVNSVDFHPDANRFCVTFTHNDQIVIYQLDEADCFSVFQVLQNPDSKLSCPQHAVYSKDGRSLIVANWYDQTFNVYHAGPKGLFHPTPASILSPLSALKNHKPHGIALSPDGKYLAVAYGASKLHAKGIALYRVRNLKTSRANFKLLYFLETEEIIRGIPKGIAFSPDGSCLLVTLAETNSAAIYSIDWRHHTINPVPRQVLKGSATLLSRPEDIKFTPDGKYCAVSNSTQDTVSFYEYDENHHCFVHDIPSHLFQNPEAQLSFPHGLAFSSDGKYMIVTQFGPVKFNQQGNLSSWGTDRKDSVAIYKLD